MEVFALWMTLIQPPSSKPQTQRTHWSKIRAKPHIGTLPPLKQIRPWRLIKICLSATLASTDKEVPKRGASYSQLPCRRPNSAIHKKHKEQASPAHACIHNRPTLLLNVALDSYCSLCLRKQTHSLETNCFFSSETE